MKDTQIENSNNTVGFWNRVLSLVSDLFIVLIAVLFFCAIVFLVVHLFRILGTGRMLVSAIVSCSDFLSAMNWPFLVVLLVVLYRRHVLDALNEVPGFIKKYPEKEVVSVASKRGGDSENEKDNDKDNQSMHRNVPKNNNPSNVGNKPQKSIESLHVKKASRSHEEARQFEDFVLRTLQDQIGIPIYRDINLFSDRSFRFDGAIIRGNRVTGIEIVLGISKCHVERLLRIEQFFMRLSPKDKSKFDLIYCVGGDKDKIDAELMNYREKLSFPVEFRFFNNKGEL